MGGGSSKRSRPKSEPTPSSKPPKSMKKIKAKGKVKKGSSAQWAKVDGEVTFISAYERKQSVGGDSMVGPNVPRGRSRSLRFGDFAHLDRVHKVDDDELIPVDIAFFQEGKVQPEELCHICSVYTGVETLICGVCYHVYHQGCLNKIGQWSGAPDLLTSASGMWTCHQCSNLGNLLTEEEVIEVLKRLDKCSIRREDDLSLSDYLAYCHMSLQDDENKVLTREKAENARKRFAQVQPDSKARLTWCQFLNIEAVRIINKRNKNALIRLLTSPELERARDEFRILDTDMDGRITKAVAHDALDRSSRKSGYYPDETMMYIDEDLNQSISWMEFLRDRAIYIIAERPCLRPSPLAHSTTRRGSQRSSLSVATSLPVTPMQKSPPTPHGKGALRKVTATAMSVPTTPTKQHPRQSIQAGGVFRHSDSAPTGFMSFHNAAALTANEPRQHTQNPLSHHPHTALPPPVSPTRKQAPGGFPVLPPPPRPSSHHGHSRSSSHPKASDACGAYAAQHSDSSQPQRLSGGSDCSSGGAKRLSAGSGNHPGVAGNLSVLGNPSGVLGNPSGLPGNPSGLPGHPFQQQSGSRRSSQEGPGNPPGLPANPSGLPGPGHPFQQQSYSRRSSQEDGSSPGSSSVGGGGGGHVTSKPPLGGSVHGRAVAGPPYGNLVARVQKGDYRQTQVRSMYVAENDKLCLQAANSSSFGTVTGDNNTGKRPLSLV